MSTSAEERPASWFSAALNTLTRALRPEPSNAASSAPKLEPIADILSRTGREHSDSK